MTPEEQEEIKLFIRCQIHNHKMEEIREKWEKRDLYFQYFAIAGMGIAVGLIIGLIIAVVL
jgi:hypothetical protein